MKFFFTIVIKLFALAAFIPVLCLVLIYGLISLLIDLFTSIKESEVMDNDEAKKRAIERKNERAHKIVDLCLDYIKFIFQ